MQVIRVVNPQVFDVALVREFLCKVFPEGSYGVPKGYAQDEERVKNLTKNKDYGMFLGVEEDNVVGFLLIQAPKDAEFAQLWAFHNDGSAKMRKELLDKGLEFAKNNGHLELRAVNTSGQSDSVWARGFKRAGDWEKIGSIMRVKWDSLET